MKTVKVCDHVAAELSRLGIATVFGYTGGSVADLVDSLCRAPALRFVQTHHEQAAAFAANAYAQIAGTLGVAISSSGPGACNLISGIANAYYDSIPCLFITGNVHSRTLKIANRARQNGFQETAIVSLVRAITKFAATVVEPGDFVAVWRKALSLATEGRPGPVLLDLPYDVLRSEIAVDVPCEAASPLPVSPPDFDVGAIATMLSSAQKPLILVGGGARSPAAREQLRRWLARVRIPVVASLCGLDVLANDHECFVGFVGSYGHRYANLAVAFCDVLLVLGSRLDERQTGGRCEDFAPHARIVHVDIDEHELKRVFPDTLCIHGKVEWFLGRMLETGPSSCDFPKWSNVLACWKERYPSFTLDEMDVNGNNFVREVSKVAGRDVIACADVGQNQMFVAQSFSLSGERRLLNSAGFGAMGYALPAAIGASFARRGEDILCFVGDGGLQMNLQELQTIVREHLPVHICVLNNRCLGMIRRLQEFLLGGRTYASAQGYSAPDFGKIADAYGLDFMRIDSPSQYSQVGSLLNTGKPSLIDVRLPQGTRTLPEPGKRIFEQIPLLSPTEWNGIQAQGMF